MTDVSHRLCSPVLRSLSGGVKRSSSPGPSAKQPRSLPPEELAQSLTTFDGVHRAPWNRGFLVLDCRSFVAYNLSHIQGALNISCCDRFSKKRLQCGKTHVADLASRPGESKKQVKDRYSSADRVVIYDDNTKDFDQLSPAHPLQLVWTCLLKEGKCAYLLQGGLHEFQSSFGNLCAKNASPSPLPLYSPTTPQLMEPDIDSATASRVLGFLYLGNERDAACEERLRELGITHVLNVTANVPTYFEQAGRLVYKRLPASDCGRQNLKQYFAEAVAFIDVARLCGGRVLVHCQAGVSRSATIVIAYLLQHSSLSMTDAFRFVKSKRSIIAPNFNFMGQLMELEQRLQSGDVARLTDPPLQLESDV